MWPSTMPADRQPNGRSPVTACRWRSPRSPGTRNSHSRVVPRLSRLDRPRSASARSPRRPRSRPTRGLAGALSLPRVARRGTSHPSVQQVLGQRGGLGPWSAGSARRSGRSRSSISSRRPAPAFRQQHRRPGQAQPASCGEFMTGPSHCAAVRVRIPNSSSLVPCRRPPAASQPISGAPSLRTPVSSRSRRSRCMRRCESSAQPVPEGVRLDLYLLPAMPTGHQRSTRACRALMPGIFAGGGSLSRSHGTIRRAAKRPEDGRGSGHRPRRSELPRGPPRRPRRRQDG